MVLLRLTVRYRIWVTGTWREQTPALPLVASGLRKIAVGVPPLCNFLFAKVFYARKILRIFLIGHKNPSFTTKRYAK